MSVMKYQCLCCGNYTLTEKPEGNYDICPVCFWEDDPLAAANPDEACSCNRVSLHQARRNYAEFGACSKDMLSHVRPPLEEEKNREVTLYHHRVQYYETDKMGIVHHSNYIRWMEEARIDFLGQIGWSYDKLEEMGVISPVTAVDCKYKVSTRFPDVITIAVYVEEFKGVKLKLRYEMKKDDVLVCEGTSEHCFLDGEGRIINVKRAYPGLYEALERAVR